MVDMEPDRLLRDKGLELPVFVPPPDPPWEWGGRGIGPPQWIPNLRGESWLSPGGAWFNINHELPARAPDLGTTLWLGQFDAHLRAREHYGIPVEEPLPEGLWTSAPNPAERLADIAVTKRLFDQSDGPRAMPQLPIKVPRQKYGRPRLERTRPDHVQRLAWLRDLCDHPIRDRRGPRVNQRRAAWTHRGLARAVYGDDDESNRKQVTREINAGRRLLHDHGVLPWAIFDTGRLPPEWWLDTFFYQATKAWVARRLLNRHPDAERLRADERVYQAILNYILK